MKHLKSSLWLTERDGKYAIFDGISLKVAYLSHVEAESLQDKKKQVQLLNLLSDIGFSINELEDPKAVLFKYHNIETSYFEAERVSGLRIVLTNKCNLNCKYCFVDTNNTQQDMTFDEIKRILDHFIKNNDRNLPVTIQWFGGEPTLKLPLIKKADEYINKEFKSYNIRRTLVTNGFKISDELLEYLDNEKYGVGVSLDGPPEINDKTRISLSGNNVSTNIIKNIEKFQDYEQIDLGINITATEHNVDKLDKVVEYFIDELGVKFFYFNFPIACNESWNFSGIKLANSLHKARLLAISRGATFVSGIDRIIDGINYQLPQLADHLEVDRSLFISAHSGLRINVTETNFEDKTLFFEKGELPHVKELTSKGNKLLFPFPECLKCPSIALCGGPSIAEQAYRPVRDNEFCKFVCKATENAIWSGL